MRALEAHRIPEANASAVSNLAIALFIIGAVSLELNTGTFRVNPWNITMVAFLALSVIATLIRSKVLLRPLALHFFAYDYAFLAFLVYCGLTAGWSVSPSDTIAHVGFLSCAWLSTVILRGIPLPVLVKNVVYAAGWVALASFIMIMVSPEVAFQPSYSHFPELKGIFNHQLRLGMFMSIAFGLIILTRFNNESKQSFPTSSFHRVIITLLIGACCIAAFARLNMFFIAIALVITILLMKNMFTRICTIIASCSLAWILINNPTSLIAWITGDPENTLTGRIGVWERTRIAIAYGEANGYGFATFADSSFQGFWGDYRAPSAHNSFLQVQFETGVLGVVLLSIFIALQVYAGYRCAVVLKRYSYSLFLSLSTLLVSLTGIAYGGKSSLLLLLTFMFVGAESVEARRAMKNRPT